ncbi:MAG TPA: type IV pilin protein, partial [Terriglobales bacterium]|nr:type IV pilin protein [Terriglobales bacterium]
HAFEKHMPEHVLEVFNKADSGWARTYMGPLSELQRQATTEGQHLETFETGPILLSGETMQANHQQRMEVTVERDDLSGEDDQMELALHIYKDGMPDKLPVVPNLILDMKQERDIWRLSQITVALHIPLSDPDYIDGIAEDMRKNHQRMLEFGALGIVQQMKEKELARQKKSAGFTCNISELGFAPEASTSPTYAAMVQPPADAQTNNPPAKDYSFKISDCSASAFQITAEPMKGSAARRSFCIDQAGTPKFSNDGKASTCTSSGRPIEEMYRDESGSGSVRGFAID